MAQETISFDIASEIEKETSAYLHDQAEYLKRYRRALENYDADYERAQGWFRHWREQFEKRESE